MRISKEKRDKLMYLQIKSLICFQSILKTSTLSFTVWKTRFTIFNAITHLQSTINCNIWNCMRSYVNPNILPFSYHQTPKFMFYPLLFVCIYVMDFCLVGFGASYIPGKVDCVCFFFQKFFLCAYSEYSYVCNEM